VTYRGHEYYFQDGLIPIAGLGSFRTKTSGDGKNPKGKSGLSVCANG